MNYSISMLNELGLVTRVPRAKPDPDVMRKSWALADVLKRLDDANAEDAKWTWARFEEWKRKRVDLGEEAP